MFEARLKEGRIFKQIIEAIKDLVTDANLEISPEELSMQCMDASHVSLVAVNFASAAFNHYRCDRKLSLGINSANLSKIMKMMNNDDQLFMKAEDSQDTLTLMFENDKTDTIADFELKLMQIDADQLAIPDTSYKCTIKMPAGEFQRIVRDFQVIGDTCTISCTKEGMRFSVAGAMGTGNIHIRSNGTQEDEDKRVIIDMQEPVELNFALRYLNFFTKASPLSKTVVIRMSPDVPIVVEYPIDTFGHIKFFLAPKIEDMED